MPILESCAADLYDRLTPIAKLDADNNWALANYCGAIGTMLQIVDDYARDQVVGDRLAPGWSQLLDPLRCPVEALPFLGMFVGVVVDTAQSEALQRQQVMQANGWQRGTLGAIIAAAAAQLTGTKSVTIVERDPTASPAWPAYGLSVYTRVGETPSSAKVLAALMTQKPAGIILNYQTVPDATYQDIFTNYATYQVVYTTFTTYEGVYTRTPGE
jgi:hypothetical protein